jgi:hypothetical protein
MNSLYCPQELPGTLSSAKVTSVWIPRHQGIPVVEEADRLAKEGAIKVPPSQTAVIPLSVGKKLIKRDSEVEYQARWVAASLKCC